MTTAKNTLDPASWVALHGDYLFSFCMVRVNDRANAEDLVQETFISAIKGRDYFKGDSSERTWLTAILKNKITDFYRKKDVLKGSRDYLEATGQDFSKHFFDSADGHWLPGASPKSWAEPADLAVNREDLMKVVQMCIHKMPSTLVPVFTAKFLDDEDSETICKVHNISSSNYWVIIHRAKVLMRSCLEKNWFSTK
jgi:RNA polymerase sigma-70 factor (TIGR02943 family)